MNIVPSLNLQAECMRDGQKAVPRYNVFFSGLLVREERARIATAAPLGR
jgi:hypothetical protein